MQAFKVMLGTKEIDKVFYNDQPVTKEEIYDSLVNHDGYNPRIKIVKER